VTQARVAAIAKWCCTAGLVLPIAAAAQTDVTCIPVAERAGRTTGCFITARHDLGPLPSGTPLYWHIDSYRTRSAAERAQGARGSVVESLGQTWLFSIEPESYRAAQGQHVARIGPLPLVDARDFAAIYMEGVFDPGMTTMVHRHPGVEAWFTLEGSMCLETPHGRLEQRAGDPGLFVRAGVPMQLTGTGKGRRRSLVLILQDASQPRSTPAPDWTPSGLCGSPPPKGR
jgi:quercetin dioxygenase-like cupin family protein